MRFAGHTCQAHEFGGVRKKRRPAGQGVGEEIGWGNAEEASGALARRYGYELMFLGLAP